VEQSIVERRRLRVLHLIAHSEAGGLSRYVHDLCAGMQERGHEVRVAGARGAGHWMFERARFEFIETPLDKGPLGLWRATRQLRRELARRPVDVIHSHYRRTSMVGRRLQRRGAPPLLYTVHLSDMPLGWRSWLSGDFGDHVHVASGEARRWSVEQAGIDPAKISLIPHGIHVECYPRADESARAAARRGLGLAAEDRVAVYVGRLDDPKNEEWLLEVAERSRGAIPKLKLVVAGSGPHSVDFLRQIRERKLENRVMYLGERKDPLDVYQAADAMLLPSQREGFSLATAEAMSVGVPVCRTRTAGAAELIVENVTGRSTPIQREAFVNAAIEFLADDAALRRMSAGAAAHVRAHFTFERQLEEMILLYRRLAGASSQTADAPMRAHARAGAS
jgi:glycosyltransferase involved in cell wall biosynthesis